MEGPPLGCGDVVAPRRGRVGRPPLDRRPRALGSARLLDRTPPDERAPGPARVLAPSLVLPRASARRRHDPDLEPLRDARLPLRGGSPERVALPAPDGAVHGALARRGDARDDPGAAAPRGTGPVRVPAGRRCRPRRRDRRRARDRGRDGRQRGRDRDAVRRRARVDVGGTARGRRVPTRRTLVAATVVARPRRPGVVPAGERAPVARPRDGDRGARGLRRGADRPRRLGPDRPVPGGAPRARDAGARAEVPVPVRVEPVGGVRLARRCRWSGGRRGAPVPERGLGRLAPRLRRCPGCLPRRRDPARRATGVAAAPPPARGDRVRRSCSSPRGSFCCRRSWRPRGSASGSWHSRSATSSSTTPGGSGTSR